MMKKILFLATFVVTFFTNAQAPSSTAITFTKASYELTEDITFTLTYTGGNNGDADYTMANVRAVLATRNIAAGDGFADFASENLTSINGTTNGSDVALTRGSRGGTFQTSAELAALPTPREHVMYIQYETSADPGTQLFGTSVVVTLTAPATVVDAWEFNFAGDITQASSVNIPVIYSSADPIVAGGIRFDLRSDTTPFTTAWIGTYENAVELPAGTNLTADIIVSNIPAIYTLEDTDGGILLANKPVNELLARNPNGATNPTDAFYRLQPLSSNDANFTPSGTTQGFRGISQDTTLDTEDLKFSSVKVYPNPTDLGFINISGLEDAKLVTIHNLLGQKVKTTNNISKVNVSGLNKGIYFLQTDNGLTRKIVIN